MRMRGSGRVDVSYWFRMHGLGTVSANRNFDRRLSQGFRVTYHGRMKRTVAVLVMVALLGSGCFRFQENKKKPEEPAFKPIPEALLQPSATSSGLTVDAVPADLEVPPEDPKIAPGQIASRSGNLVLSSVVPNQTLNNPFTILGRARAFENVVRWRLKDGRNKIIAEGSAQTNAPASGRFGAFSSRAFYGKPPETDAGTFEIFTILSDGSEGDLVSVTVALKRDLMPVKIFFTNVIEDPNHKRCEIVSPFTRRLVSSEHLADQLEIAARELVGGPSTLEGTQGARTSILPSTRIRSIREDNGVVTIDFTSEFVFAFSDACTRSAVRAQVNETLKQFKGVTVVRILVDGADAETILNP